MSSLIDDGEDALVILLTLSALGLAAWAFFRFRNQGSNLLDDLRGTDAVPGSVPGNTNPNTVKGSLSNFVDNEAQMFSTANDVSDPLYWLDRGLMKLLGFDDSTSAVPNSGQQNSVTDPSMSVGGYDQIPDYLQPTSDDFWDKGNWQTSY